MNPSESVKREKAIVKESTAEKPVNGKEKFVRESMAKKPVRSIPGLEKLDERLLEKDKIFCAADLFVEYLFEGPACPRRRLRDWKIPDEDIYNVFDAFDDWLEERGYKQMNWSLKHERFVKEPMGDKSVGCVPGIGRTAECDLVEEGIRLATNLSETYCEKGPKKFRKWLHEDFGIPCSCIDRVIFAFDDQDRRQVQAEDERERTAKFKPFVGSSMTGKRVESIPGIGDGSPIKNKEIKYAADLFVEYLDFGKDKFVDWLKNYLKMRSDHTGNVIGAFEEWMKRVRIITRTH